jgi:hypothetical protein
MMHKSDVLRLGGSHWEVYWEVKFAIDLPIDLPMNCKNDNGEHRARRLG